MFTNDTYKTKRITGTLALCLMLLMTTLSAQKALAQDEEVYVPEQDSMALVAFYHSMSGDFWLNNGGWLIDRVDTWHGIETENVGTEEDPEWRVVEIDLRRNMTRPGTLPPEIGELEYLTDLVLRHDPSLFGEWPQEIEKLSRWRHVRTQNTNMSGEIPWVAFSKTDMREFRLQGAKHHGPIPDIFGDMEQLFRIQIDNQFLSGDIPPSVDQLVNLDHFRLDGNLLTGDLPDLSGLPVLTRIHIGGNPLDPAPLDNWSWMTEIPDLDEIIVHNTNRQGTVPEWFLELYQLEKFSLGETSWELENPLGGVFPDMSHMIELDELHFYGPHWEGPIPEWIGMDARTTVNMYFCSFEGPIPGNFINVDRMRFHNMPELTGGIPPEFEMWSGRTFQIDHSESWNSLFERFGPEAADYFSNPQMEVGQIPDWIGNFSSRNIHLANAGVTGTIPETLLQNEGLQSLLLHQNPDLTGPLPEGLQDLPISTLNVSYTGLDIDEIPEWLLELRGRLSGLGLAGLGIEGPIPEWLGEMTLLRSLDLSDNNFAGEIPASFSELNLMSALNLSNNQLSGSLPDGFEEVGYLDGFYTLHSLDLSCNEELEGPIPERFKESLNMRVIRYNDTGLWAPDDEEFAYWLETIIPGNRYAVSHPWLYVDVQTSGLVGGPPVSAENPDSPYRFHLSDNYPNPFNPTTTISYEIPAEGHVTLTIYNVIGQHVATLVDNQQQAGAYQVNFDATNLASGTYIYRLQAGERVLSQSMMLIK